MMNRKINAVVILSSVLVLGFSLTAKASSNWITDGSGSGPGVALQKEEKKQEETKENVFGWIKDSSTSKWWYKNSDGTYPTNSWVWLDGDRNGLFECYFFDNEGWMLSNTTTPDGYTVDENGAWTKDDQVERRTKEELNNPKAEETKPEEENLEADMQASETNASEAGVEATENQDDDMPIPPVKLGSGEFNPEVLNELSEYGRSRGLTGGKYKEGLNLSFSRQYDGEEYRWQANSRKYVGENYLGLTILWVEGRDYVTYSADDSNYWIPGHKNKEKIYSVDKMKEIIDELTTKYPTIRR